MTVRPLAFILTLALLAVSISCTQRSENRLVGKWKLQAKNGNEVLEFFGDGSYRTEADYGIGAGKWRFADKGHLALWSHKIRLQAGTDAPESQPWADISPNERIHFRVDKDFLILGLRGGPYKYRRLE